MKLKIVNTMVTNNFTDSEMLEKIGNMWQNETVKELLAKQQKICGVYHDYESNYRGDYHFSLCVETTDNDFDFDTEENTYQTFSMASANDALETWQKIWDLEEKGKLNRTYTFDYEEYSPNSEEVKIQIAVK